MSLFDSFGPARLRTCSCMLLGHVSLVGCLFARWHVDDLGRCAQQAARNLRGCPSVCLHFVPVELSFSLRVSTTFMPISEGKLFLLLLVVRACRDLPWRE